MAAMLIAMRLNEYLLARHFVAEALAREGTTGLPWLFPPDVMLAAVAQSLGSDPLTLLFWGIALWTAFRLPTPRRLPRA
jgi:hypothetical protein